MVSTCASVSHIMRVTFLSIIYSFKSSNSLSPCTVDTAKLCLLYCSMMHCITFMTRLFACEAITQQCIKPMCCNMAVFTNIISISKCIYFSILPYASNISFVISVMISEHFILFCHFVLFPFTAATL